MTLIHSLISEYKEDDEKVSGSESSGVESESSGVESEVDANLKRAQALRQSVLSKSFMVS